MAIKIYTLLMLASTLIGYGQNVTLLKNFNPKVKELKHSLNESRDSLNLICESKIVKVEIYNEDYEETFAIEDFHSLIPLEDLPEGKFVVDVQLVDKIVEMHIIKHKNLEEDTDSALNKDDIIEGNGMMLDEEFKVIKNSPKISVEFLLTGSKRKNPVKKKQKFYWIVLEVCNGSNSYKSMKLVSENVAEKMISKNKLDAKTDFGKRNKLTVWEVYNSSEFMKNQVADPNYINSTSSDFFNVAPYYTSTKNLIALQ
ncbi:hypothetical protein [Winogradskyella ouciana]|uniref:Uncharacterized protein n=1 Tax=Winogradskyella ouciana TaxID=2608631 RepID=A0A7K1GIM8_9FLAO|nr:hypothetical protein [Winogradskyella ouciana]MTE28089.1 hypothetical protein [Winogradskyella ouciana]